MVLFFLMRNKISVLISKLRACIREINSDFTVLSLIVLGPLALFIGIFLLRNCLTLGQAGILIQIFTVVPVGVELWERLQGSQTEFNWVGLHIRNFAHHRGWKRIMCWLDRHNHFDKFFRAYPLGLALFTYLLGLLLQLFAN